LKVLALIYGDETRWTNATAADREVVMGQYRAFGAAADDKIADGAELASTSAATTVRVRDGKTVVTDGPFAETKEQLGGFYVFDVGSLDEAAELAARVPGASDGAVELRAAHEEPS
jgi:hypothetical protein